MTNAGEGCTDSMLWFFFRSSAFAAFIQKTRKTLSYPIDKIKKTCYNAYIKISLRDPRRL
jgi:hypothetical protein